MPSSNFATSKDWYDIIKAWPPRQMASTANSPHGKWPPRQMASTTNGLHDKWLPRQKASMANDLHDNWPPRQMDLHSKWSSTVNGPPRQMVLHAKLPSTTNGPSTANGSPRQWPSTAMALYGNGLLRQWPSTAMALHSNRKGKTHVSRGSGTRMAETAGASERLRFVASVGGTTLLYKGVTLPPFHAKQCGL
jgi:hypothetical protein